MKKTKEKTPNDILREQILKILFEQYKIKSYEAYPLDKLKETFLDNADFRWNLSYLSESNLLRHESIYVGKDKEDISGVKITVKGINFLEKN